MCPTSEQENKMVVCFDNTSQSFPKQTSAIGIAGYVQHGSLVSMMNPPSMKSCKGDSEIASDESEVPKIDNLAGILLDPDGNHSDNSEISTDESGYGCLSQSYSSNDDLQEDASIGLIVPSNPIDKQDVFNGFQSNEQPFTKSECPQNRL